MARSSYGKRKEGATEIWWPARVKMRCKKTHRDQQ
jgi:hypothetical protein